MTRLLKACAVISMVASVLAICFASFDQTTDRAWPVAIAGCVLAIPSFFVRRTL